MLAALSDPSQPPGDHADTIVGDADTDGERVKLAQPWDERYAGEHKLLGKGGVGRVLLVRDQRIRRDVALKEMRNPKNPAVERRFLREARVQGQVEHPAVVPVYDLGLKPDGSVFFTMKRIEGRTLQAVLTGPDERCPSRRKLLTAFSTVCQAVECAHGQGILHRDLKPANIMFGDHGEVYVLDWGLAKILDGPASVNTPMDERSYTSAGKVLGTPGYMSPQQLAGAAIDARSDVYALGAVLFEILTKAKLHQFGSDIEEMVRSTMTLTEDEVSLRLAAPELDIPPELVDVVGRATARIHHRYDTVAVLRAAVDAYLDGDRDLELRVEASARHAERAATAPVQTEIQRASAMQALGRALALDPTNALAIGTLKRLLEDLPADLPAEAVEALEAGEAKTDRAQALVSAIAFVGWLANIGAGVTIGITSYPAYGAVAACVLGGLIMFVVMARHERPVRLWWLAMPVSMLTTAASTVYFGPLIITPQIATANAVAACVLARTQFQRAIATLVAGAAVAVPLVLEWTGVTPAQYLFDDGRWTILPWSIAIEETPTRLIVLAASIAVIVGAAALVGWFRHGDLATKRRVHGHVWHLEQLFPGTESISRLGGEGAQSRRVAQPE